MASDVAQPDAAHIDTIHSSLPNDVPMTNGNHEGPESDVAPNDVGAFPDSVAASKPELDTKVSDVPPASDSNPTGPSPIEGVSSGIASVADFIPKDARTSHPTPPPDEPLAASEANVDTDMPTVDEPPQATGDSSIEAVSAEPAPATLSAESSLVRPREEDDESDEPAAKRSKVDEESAQIPSALEAPSGTSPSDDLIAAAQPSTPDAIKAESVADAPVATAPTADPEAPEAQPAPATEVKPAEVDTQPSVEAVPPPAAPPLTAPATAESAVSTAPIFSRDPITPAQHKFLHEKMKNLKKTKNSTAFLNPVDPIALGIPSYLDIIKTPMDLFTMENKLKNAEYKSVQSFADDFDLIIQNTRRFNGDSHAVTQAGFSMEAYFRKMMESVPSTDQPVVQKAQTKKSSPKPPVPRRESRSAVVTTSPTATSNPPTFALQPNGTPQIRRDSTINRPSRAIKPPQNREISYAKPKRKEAQLELKFCEHVLSQVRGPKYAHLNAVFQQPVDPVALNIPHYRQIVKNPMDLSTMSNKLKQGEYGKASEFKKDFDLMVQNCLAFNPTGNAVRDMGISLQRVFEDLWRGKEKWERSRKAETQRATSASGDEDSGEEEEEEEEEEEGVPEDAAGTIKALQKQLAEMQSALAGLGKPAKQKKTAKAAGKPGKKAAAASTASKAKPAPKAKLSKKPKQVTYEEKQEISEAVGKMNNSQIEELTRIITTNCKKYADQEEMELEIDDLPNDVQAMLLQYVRGLFGNPNRRHRAASPDDIAAVDDDDFEPDRKGRGGGGSKRKKHKPMGKKEQQDTISSIQAQLRQFQNVGTSGSESPTNSNAAANQGAESSDDESEESEEE